MIDIAGRIRWIRAKVNHLFNISNALLTLRETGGSVNTTVINTQYDIYRVESPVGVFKPIIVQVDFTNQTAAETVVIRTYYRIAGSGGLLKKDEQSFIGVQDPILKNIELEPNRHGIQVTIERIAGAAQDYPWGAHYEA